MSGATAAPVDARAARAALRGGSPLRDTLVVAVRNLRALTRQPQLVVFSTIQPVMLVLLFNFVFGGALEAGLPGDVAYIDFLLPGVLIQVVAFGTAQTSVGMAQDISRGIVDRFRSLPMARSAVLAGRVTADVVRIVWTVALVSAVGAALGWRTTEGWLAALGAYVVVVGFGLAFSWIAAWIGMSIRDPETAQVAGFVWLFPIVFASSAFVRIETFDPWLEAFAEVNPITIFVDLTRSLTMSGPAFELTGDLVWQAAAWSAAILALFGPLSVAQYRRVT